MLKIVGVFPRAIFMSKSRKALDAYLSEPIVAKNHLYRTFYTNDDFGLESPALGPT